MTLAAIAVPAMMTFVLGSLAELINTYFIGRYLSDPRALAGAGMGNILISMMCLAVFYGLNGALETLISQVVGASAQSAKRESFGSNGRESKSKTKDMVVVFLNQGRVIIFLAFIPITALLSNVNHILVSLGQDPETSRLARLYIMG
jgi:Na+-driven multidrug efflux pump